MGYKIVHPDDSIYSQPVKKITELINMFGHKFKKKIVKIRIKWFPYRSGAAAVPHGMISS